MILAFTGHRPNKLGGYYDNPITRYVRERTRSELLRLRPSRCISGMALGFDQIAASVCVDLGIPFTAAIPCPGQADVWPEASRQEWERLRSLAADVVIVSPKYSPAAMQRRNCWMVDHCDAVLACWDGTRGGTSNCIAYACDVGRVIAGIIRPAAAFDA